MRTAPRMTAAEQPRVSVADNAERHRFEIHLEDLLAGYVDYRDVPHGRAFIHTAIDSPYEGLGLGSRLIEAALDEARQAQRNVIPLCPFVRRFLRRRPSYVDLVADPKRFGLTPDDPPTNRSRFTPTDGGKGAQT